MDIYERLEKEFASYPISFSEGDGGMLEVVPKDYSIYRGRIGYWDDGFEELVKYTKKYLERESIKPK